MSCFGSRKEKKKNHPPTCVWLVQTVLFTKQERRHRRREQTRGWQGERGVGWGGRQGPICAYATDALYKVAT